jgi:acetylglutamate kinase
MKRVVKIGGRAQSSSDLAERIAAAWQENPGSLCVVHGGGDRISEFQRRVGLEPSFVDGRRVTTRQDMEIVRMVLSGLVNKELVAAFATAGLPAVGISGEDAATITATPIDATGLGRAGKPVAVRSELIELLLDGGYLPVISPLAGEDGPTGEALNVNADDAAAAIAIALAASELLLIADVEGVLDESGKLIASLDQSDAGELIQNGVINRGMRAKLEAGFAALAGGVGRVRISTLEGLTDSGAGTLLTFAQSLIT